MGGFQDPGPPLGLLVVERSHLHGQAVGLGEQLVLTLRLHLFHHLHESRTFTGLEINFKASLTGDLR